MRNHPINRREAKSAAIYWRRGMFRLWVLLSAAWMMGWLIFYAIEIIGGAWTARDFLVVPVVLFGPPVALFVFGVAARWAIRGFES
jgi:hypothetical protein